MSKMGGEVNFVVETREIVAESGEIVGKEKRAAHFRVDGFAKCVCKSRTQRKRR